MRWSSNQASGAFDYVDVMGERITGDRRLEVEAIVLGGRLWSGDELPG